MPGRNGSAGVLFRYYPLRLRFAAQEPLFFPPGKAANTLRGALGTVFRRLSCTPDCADARTCHMRQSCAYARVFEPTATAPGPSGLADWPRPFVFRARHLDNRTIAAGELFSFHLNLFTADPRVRARFVETFAELGREGMGPGRGKALPQAGNDDDVPITIDLSPDAAAPRRIRIAFLTPTELKAANGIAATPEFSILFGRLRDRIATLGRLYGDGVPDVDFTETNARAAAVRMTNCDLRPHHPARRSSKTGHTHTLGGFTGTAEYEGDLAPFLPWLRAGSATGVGRHAVWGNGEIGVEPVF